MIYSSESKVYKLNKISELLSRDTATVIELNEFISLHNRLKIKLRLICSGWLNLNPFYVRMS